MRKIKKLVPYFLGLCFVAAMFLFARLSGDRQPQVEVLPETSESLDSWTVDSSLANGLPLDENKSVYADNDGGRVNYVYITVYPTKDEAGITHTFNDFSRHTSREKVRVPILDANVVFGEEDGTLNGSKDTKTVNSTIQVRGNSARGAKYKSYKIKFREDTELFENQAVLNLNKHESDISKVTNKFCMDIMAQMNDMASFRTSFMIVYIRDASLPKEEQEYRYYGLYTHVEQPNKSYLRARDLDTGGNMYKANNFEFRLSDELKNVDDPLYDEEAFETVLKIREGSDHTRLLQMLQDVNDMNKDFEEVFSTWFNEENYLTWMASNILLGNEDTLAHNFILYNPKDSLTWYFLPWDYDGTFKMGEYASSYAAPPELKGIQRMTGVILHRRYFRQPGNIEKLTAKMEELMNTCFTQEKVNGLINSYLPVMEKVLLREPDLSFCQIPPNEYTEYLSGFYGQILKNRNACLEALKYPQPVFVSEPVKKEDGSMLFAWEPSWDYSGGTVSYGIRLAHDVNMEQVIFEENGLTDNTYIYEQGLPEGIYYLEVSIVDEQGNRQYSLDFCKKQDGRMKFGTREVKVTGEETD